MNNVIRFCLMANLLLDNNINYKFHYPFHDRDRSENVLLPDCYFFIHLNYTDFTINITFIYLPITS